MGCLLHLIFGEMSSERIDIARILMWFSTSIIPIPDGTTITTATMSSASSLLLSNDIASWESLSKMSSYLVLKIGTSTDVLYSVEMLYTVLVHQRTKRRQFSSGLQPLHTPNNQQKKGRLTSFNHFLTSMIILVGQSVHLSCWWSIHPHVKKLLFLPVTFQLE